MTSRPAPPRPQSGRSRLRSETYPTTRARQGPGRRNNCVPGAAPALPTTQEHAGGGSWAGAQP